MEHTWSEYVDDISYLKLGGERRRAAYLALTELDLFCVLADFDPVLAGSFPLGLELHERELEIVCHAPALEQLAALMTDVYGNYDEFALERTGAEGTPGLVCRFQYHDFHISILGQTAPSREQDAYRHLVAESRLLRLAGPSALDGIRRLKADGFETVPAFGAYFRLGDEPTRALLDLADAPAEDLEEIIVRSAHLRWT